MRQKRADSGGTPFCVKPELVEGCSMSTGRGSGGLCNFCGIQAIRSGSGGYKYMDPNLAALIAQQMEDFCPKARIEFAMHGEPLMHPNYISIFTKFRSHLPNTQLQVTTNGDILRGKMQQRVEKIFNAGINFILMDTYYPKDRRDSLRKEAFSLKNIEVVDYYEDWALDDFSPYANHGNKIQRTILLMDDILIRDQEEHTRIVKSHAGSNPLIQIDQPIQRSCARPFREMTITWNGNVTLCCDDWKSEYVIANISDLSMEEIWKHPKYEAARARLHFRERGFGPCAKCDAPGAPRFGLLPLYDPPTEKDVQITEETFKYKEPLWHETNNSN